MEFRLIFTNTVDLTIWNKNTIKLRDDLLELTNQNVPEAEVLKYLNDMIDKLRSVDRDSCRDMLFLMYDMPSSMPADSRVEYVYKPTYYAATIIMTAINRYEGIARNTQIINAASSILLATTARRFLGAGYDDNVGLLETLEIFAMGEVVDFIEKYPNINKICCNGNKAFELFNKYSKAIMQEQKTEIIKLPSTSPAKRRPSASRSMFSIRQKSGTAGLFAAQTNKLMLSMLNLAYEHRDYGCRRFR